MKFIKITFYLFLTLVLLNACQKEYSIESGGLKHTGSWQFNDSLQLFSGNMDSVYIDSSSSTKVLHLIGTSLNGSQTFHMQLFADTFKTGTYKASLFQSSFQYSATAKTIYQADQLVGEFIVNITTYSNSLIAGTFSGAAIDSANNIKQLTLGKFTSAIGQNGTGVSVSSGVLGDSSGNCKPVTLSGTYTQGVALIGANTVQVQVTVAAAGTYSITSNTVNGVTFSNTGTFTSTGVQNVILNGSGTPLSSGVQNFTISYGNSQCAFKINFGTAATGTLGGGGGSCTPFTIAGTYQQGIQLNASNTVQIQVTVTAPGSYNITTDTVNNVSFSNSGTFTSTGVQIITLIGSGTPLNAGAQNFAVTFGASTCNFSITFLPAALPPGDYFPLTLNSNWTYSHVGGTAADSIHFAVISYSPSFGSNTYKTIAAYNVPPAAAFDSLYYRKPGGDYYQYARYSNYFPFDAPVSGEFIFLKDNVATGTTWVSPNISGTIGGLPVTAFIKMTILAKAVPITIGIFNFPDVIQVKYEYFILGIATPFETDERWFAKNAGEIHDSFNNGTSTNNYDISNFLIF
jgi:hypothetical protein